MELAYATDSVELCVERLEAHAESFEGEDRRALLGRAARVAEEDLQKWEEAERLYERVMELTAASDERQEDLVRRRLICLSRIVGREEQALEMFERLLDQTPFEPAAFRAMLQLFEREQAHDRARLSRQVLTALNCQVEPAEGRKKMRPSQIFDERTLETHLLPTSLDPDVFHVLRKSMPLVEKVFSEALPQRKVLDGSRVSGEDGLSRALHDATAAFEIGRYSAEEGDSGPPMPQVFGQGNPDFWFNQHVVESMGEAEQYFTAGFVSALGWSGLAPVLELDGRSIWHLIEGTWLRQTGSGFEERVDVESQRMSEEIGSPFLAVTRRRIRKAIEPVVEEFPGTTPELWPEQVEEFACRVGLVVCGDLAAAIRCLLRFRGWELDLDAPETRDQITRIDLVGRLIQFAFSQDYLESRYAVGLSARPSELKACDPREWQ